MTGRENLFFLAIETDMRISEAMRAAQRKVSCRMLALMRG
jgi:hypothetical protein